MKRLFTLCLFLVGFVLSSQAQINVIHIAEGVSLGNKQGFYYALPTTLIKVELDVQKTEYIVGPYAEYAERYLGLTNVPGTDYNHYSIIGAKLSDKQVPDIDQLYFVEVQGKLSKENKAVLFSLSEYGLASGVNGNIPLDQARDGSIFINQEDQNKPDFTYFAESNLFEQIDTIIQRVVVDTVMVEKIHYDRKWVEKASEDKAIDAAGKIGKIREARYNLLSGYQEIAYDAGTIAYMDENLEELEKEYLSLFTGIAHSQVLQYTFYIKPDAEINSQKIPVFNFSDRSGVKPASAVGGEVVSLQVEKLSAMGDLNTILSTRETQISANHGFYYRIPVATQFNLEFSNGLTTNAIIPVNQFGAVVSLPPDVINAVFYPTTGGVKNIIAE